MKRTLIWRAHILIIILAFAMPVAGAQNISEIGIVNFETVIVQSFAWQDFIKHVKNESKNLQKELPKQQKKLAKKIERFNLEKDRLSDEARQNELNSIEILRNHQIKKLQKDRARLEEKYGKTQNYIRNHIYQILREMSEEKGLKLILNSGKNTNAVILADKQIDLTKQTLLRLNQRLPKIDDEFLKTL